MARDDLGPRCYFPDEEPEKDYIETWAVLGLDNCSYCGQDHQLADCPIRPLKDWMK